MGIINPIEQLKKEHKVFENLISEFKILSDNPDNLNLQKISNNFVKIYTLWNQHEKKEEELFPLLEKKDFKIHVEKVFFDHKELRPHKDAINNAIKSKDINIIKDSLYKHSVWIIDKLREHLDYENEILFILAEKEYTNAELNKMWESIKDI